MDLVRRSFPELHELPVFLQHEKPNSILDWICPDHCAIVILPLF